MYCMRTTCGQVWCNWTQPKKHIEVKKEHLKTIKPTLYFCCEKSTWNYEEKTKISSTLVQVTVIFLINQNEPQWNLKDLEKRE